MFKYLITTCLSSYKHSSNGHNISNLFYVVVVVVAVVVVVVVVVVVIELHVRLDSITSTTTTVCFTDLGKLDLTMVVRF